MTRARGGFVRLAFTMVLGGLLAMMPAAAGAQNDAALVMDAETGRVLYARSGDAARSPASLTKMMTLFLLFDYMDATGQDINGTMTASANAAAQKPTKLGVRKGDTITIGQATLALVIHSANDVSVVIAEHIGGSVPRFAKMMNEKARALGMRRTNFTNPSGLPDANQVTTARDMAILSRALMRTHPNMFRYFSATSFTYKGKTTRTHNRVLTGLYGANGIKTGYTRASGFNLTTSAERNGKRLIGVVMGGDSWKSRDTEMKTMLEAWFAQLERRPTLVASYSGRGGGLATAPAVVDVAKAEPAPKPIVVAKAEPAPKPVAKAERVVAMAPIPDEPAPVKAAPKAKAVTVAYYVPSPIAKPRTVASKNARRAVAEAPKMREMEIAEGDADDAIPARATPTGDKVLPLSTLVSNDQDDIAKLIDAGYSDTAATKSAAVKSGDWGIQIGAFDSRAAAEGEIAKARKSAKSMLKNAGDTVMAVTNEAGKTFYRARFTDFSNKSAQSACSTLKAEGFKCVTFSTARADAS